jgi:hypothetical protein
MLPVYYFKMNKRVGKKRFSQEKRGHNFQCTGIPNAKSETKPIQDESSWRRVVKGNV